MDVFTLWSRLLLIQTLMFEARSRTLSNLGWNGTGAGSVRVEPIEPSVILFHESGSWTPYQGPPTNFRNIFRWTLSAEHIRLEHLRFGVDDPVYLFDLISTADDAFQSSEPHVCGSDLYTASLKVYPTSLHLTWTITGPDKAETIAYTYN